jgi:hypothetical protein
MKKVIFILLIIVIISAVNSYAFRCGGEPIGRWDKREKVLKYCGSPQKVGYEKVFHEGNQIYAETWYYNCGEGDFIYAVSFYKGIVVKEESKERGFGKSQCGK